MSHGNCSRPHHWAALGDYPGLHTGFFSGGGGGGGGGGAISQTTYVCICTAAMCIY